MQAPSSTVDGHNLALATLEGSTHDFDGVTLADGDGSHVVLSPEILAQMTTHDLSPDAGRCREVRLSGLSTLAGHSLVGLHLSFSLDS